MSGVLFLFLFEWSYLYIINIPLHLCSCLGVVAQSKVRATPVREVVGSIPDPYWLDWCQYDVTG